MICDYCANFDGKLCTVTETAKIYTRVYEYLGAECCTRFVAGDSARCVECGKKPYGLVDGRFLFCGDCLEAIFDPGDGWATDEAAAANAGLMEVSDLIVELGGQE
jgi:hypothetical protein